MTKLAKFLGDRLAERGTSASFARRLSVSQATVTRWVMAKSEPDFENCIRIADYFEINPQEVFQFAGKPNFEEFVQPDISRVQEGTRFSE
jgi:transcriptional regulator with XRE-family HTH domain